MFQKKKLGDYFVVLVGFLFIACSLVHGQEKRHATVDTPLIAVSREGCVWMAKQMDVAQRSLKAEDGGLIDGSTFLQDGSKETLDIFVGKQASVWGNTVTFYKLKEKESGYQYAFSVKREKDEKEMIWYLSESPLYKDQFPRGKSIERNHIAIWRKWIDGKPDKLTQECCASSDLFDFVKQELRPAAILARCRAAELGRRNEYRDPARIHEFDLPKDRPIVYIGLIDANSQDDPIMASMVDDTKYLPELLVACGYKIAAATATRCISVMDDPVSILEKHIREQEKKETRDFYLNLTGHGSSMGVHFRYRKGEELRREVLTPTKLFALFAAHPRCTFTVNTVACRGGGLGLLMKDWEDPAGVERRVTMFLQVKSHGLNQEGRLKGVAGVNGAPKAHSTYYHVFLTKNLLEGRGYGMAHILADKAAKCIIPCDAEAWRSGKDGGIFTGGLWRGPPQQLIRS